MLRTIARSLLRLAMVAVGLVLALDLLYFVRGSLESFPTAEQQEKVRVVAGTIAALLVIVELVLWWVLRRLGTTR